MNRRTLLTAVFLIVAPLAVQAQSGGNFRMSQSAAGGESTAVSSPLYISGDGSSVLFTTSEPTLVSGDTNISKDAFIKDRVSGALSVGSLGPNGQFLSSENFGDFISFDGALLTFRTSDGAAVSGPADVNRHCYLKTRATGVLAGLDLIDAATFLTGQCEFSTISADGKVAAFITDPSAVTGNGDGQTTAYVRVLKTGVSTQVSKNSLDETANGTSANPSLSGDGRYMVYQTTATDITQEDTTSLNDIVLYDKKLDTNVLVSKSLAGTGGNAASTNPSISRDGKLIVFQSDASDLVAGDVNASSDCFLYDVKKKTITQINPVPAGETGPWDCAFPVISGDSNRVVMTLGSTQQGLDQVYLYLRSSNTVKRMTFDTAGTEPDDSCSKGQLSFNGRYVIFQSTASDLIASDTNNTFDVFLTEADVPLTAAVLPLPAQVDPITKKGKATVHLEYFSNPKYTLTLQQKSGGSASKTMKSTKDTVNLKGLAKGKWSLKYTVKSTVNGAVVKSKSSKAATFSVL